MVIHIHPTVMPSVSGVAGHGPKLMWLSAEIETRVESSHSFLLGKEIF